MAGGGALKNLRLLRESQKLSQTKLAEQFDLAQSQIQSYEIGAYEPDINAMIEMADFFGTSVDYLIGRTDIKRSIEMVAECALTKTEQGLVERFRRLTSNKRKSLFMFFDTLDGHNNDNNS
jgi:transcriptional regulator with XRE-family HTH domain